MESGSREGSTQLLKILALFVTMMTVKIPTGEAVLLVTTMEPGSRECSTQLLTHLDNTQLVKTGEAVLTAVTLWNARSSNCRLNSLNVTLDHPAAVQVGLEDTVVVDLSTTTQGTKTHYPGARQLVGIPVTAVTLWNEYSITCLGDSHSLASRM